MASASRKILVTGANGQLGKCLADTCSRTDEVFFCDSQAFDLTNADQMRDSLGRIMPDFILNCAAYTNVDGAESDEEQADRVNNSGVAELARLCVEIDARLIHVSTDFVFDGVGTKPYTTDQPTAPLGVYGQTKHKGELALLSHMPETAMIIRTSWLYSEHGGNFVKTMLRLFDTKESFSVVSDQFGCPTYARGLAQVMWHIVDSGHFVPGIFHWSDAGVTSWFKFAKEIGNQGERVGLISNKAELLEILAKDYGSVTPRPGYSALDCGKLLQHFPQLKQVSWESHLQEMLARLRES